LVCTIRERFWKTNDDEEFAGFWHDFCFIVLLVISGVMATTEKFYDFPHQLWVWGFRRKSAHNLNYKNFKE